MNGIENIGDVVGLGRDMLHVQYELEDWDQLD